MIPILLNEAPAHDVTPSSPKINSDTQESPTFVTTLSPCTCF